MVQGCRTSGVLTASKIVFTGQCKLISIHAAEVGGAPATFKVFDGQSNSGVEIARMTLTPTQTLEFDMHGVLCKNGLYFEEIAPSQVAVSIEFS